MTSSRASPMKLPELKVRVYESWKSLNTFKGVLAQPDNFKPEVRSFGDLRRKATWIKALARFQAVNSYKACLDAYGLILNDFNFTPARWDYEFRYEILDEFLMIPDGMDLIRLGLEQLLSSTFTPEEREEAHGFFAMVSGSAGRIRLPDGPLRRLTGAHAS